jgi:hypothetical protein
MWRFEQYVGAGLILIVAGLAAAVFRLQDWTLLILLVPAALSAAVGFRFRAGYPISIVATEFVGLALLLYSEAVARLGAGDRGGDGADGQVVTGEMFPLPPAESPRTCAREAFSEREGTGGERNGSA